MPSDSESAACPILPFFVARPRWRSLTMRASQYEAPRFDAVSSAQCAVCFIDIVSSIQREVTRFFHSLLILLFFNFEYALPRSNSRDLLASSKVHFRRRG